MVLVDWLVHHKLLDWEAYFGITLILCGFFALVFSESWEILYWQKREHRMVPASPDPRLSIAERKPGDTAVMRKKRSVLYYVV